MTTRLSNETVSYSGQPRLLVARGRSSYEPWLQYALASTVDNDSWGYVWKKNIVSL